MGRWMEIVDENGTIHMESPPAFLLYTIRAFPKHLRANFPILMRLDIDSGYYYNEVQEVLANDLLQLKEELLVIKKLINYEQFLEGLDTNKLKEFLLNETEKINEESRDCLDQMIVQISKAIGNNLKIRVLL
jgi:hypothetical protein